MNTKTIWECTQADGTHIQRTHSDCEIQRPNIGAVIGCRRCGRQCYASQLAVIELFFIKYLENHLELNQRGLRFMVFTLVRRVSTVLFWLHFRSASIRSGKRMLFSVLNSPFVEQCNKLFFIQICNSYQWILTKNFSNPVWSQLGKQFGSLYQTPHHKPTNLPNDSKIQKKWAYKLHQWNRTRFLIDALLQCRLIDRKSLVVIIQHDAFSSQSLAIMAISQRLIIVWSVIWFMYPLKDPIYWIISNGYAH